MKGLPNLINSNFINPFHTNGGISSPINFYP